MNDAASLVVVRTFTNVHEAHLAKSVLDAAGIESAVLDEHIVSMVWTYSNAVRGVKILVPDDQLEEAASLLDSAAETIEESSSADLDTTTPAIEICDRCGGDAFESRLSGKRLAVLTWMLLGVPLALPMRRRYCRRCGARRT